MTETANGGLPEAAAKPVRAKRGQDFNDALLSGADPGRIADIIEYGDTDLSTAAIQAAAERIVDIVEGGDVDFASTVVAEHDVPPHERIARLIEADDESDVVGAGPEGEQGGDRNAGDASPASPRSWGFDVEKLNRDHALVNWGGKAAVVKENPHGPINDRVQLMTFESMNTIFANCPTEVMGADGKVKVVTWARAWLTHRERRQFDGVEFFPNPDGAAGTPGYYNYWKGFEVQPSPKGSYATFRDHLFNNIAGGDEALFRYVFGWMAHIVQKPRSRLGIALVLRGKRGTGKSKVGEVLGSLFAPHYFQVDDARYVTGRFNDHMISCLLLQADEALWAGDKEAEGRLKGLITSEMQMVEAKNMPAIRVPNYIRVLMTSNEGWVVPAGADERRFCVLDVDPRCAQNHDYFKEMDDELAAGGRAALLHDLLNFDLGSVDLWQIPQTHALLDQKLRSFDSVDDFWYNRLVEGGDDWPERVVCAELYADYLKHCAHIGVGRKRSAVEFGIRIAKLVPDIRRARPAIADDRGVARRTWCYEIPSLDECRVAFDEMVGQPVVWPVLPPGGGERRRSDADDAAPV